MTDDDILQTKRAIRKKSQKIQKNGFIRVIGILTDAKNKSWLYLDKKNQAMCASSLHLAFLKGFVR